MQSVFGNHRLTHANVSLAHKFSQKDPKRGQNDARFCCNTSGVPIWIARRKTLAASRQNAGILIRRLYVRADYSRKKSDLAGAYEPEAHKPEKERFNWEAAGVILPGVDGQRKALKVAGLRYMKVADASSNKDTLKSSIPSSRLFGKLKVQSIWAPSRQDSKHDIGISGRNGEIIQSSCKERNRAENFPPKDKVDSLRFKGKTTEFAARYNQKSKNDMVTPGRRRESILESENLYEGRGKPKNDVPKHKISSLKNRGEGTEFVASSEAMPESENVYGGRGDYVYHLPRNKVKPLNVPRGEGIEFGGAADFFSLRTFKDLGSNDNMLQALKAQQIHRPSHIQAMAYKHVLDGETCIVAEQSGSGKTLAYLAPLVQRLREEEIQGKSKSLAKCPRGLVLVPTAELAAQILIDCSGEGEEKNPEMAFSNKKTALLQLVEQRPVRKTVIFCNKIETCRKVENVLKRLDRQGSKIHVLPFHAAVSQESRISNMQQFLAPQSKQSLFLICTDRASRGLELINVDHVVLFDFPRDPSEYVRRVGRTARGAGGMGKAFVFVVGKQVSLALRIIDRNEKGHPLHAVPSVL